MNFSLVDYLYLFWGSKICWNGAYFLENGDFSYTLEPAAPVSLKITFEYVRLVAVSYLFVNVHQA